MCQFVVNDSKLVMQIIPVFWLRVAQEITVWAYLILIVLYVVAQ